MALFKILQGLDTTLNSTTNPLKLTEGYCYFTIDNNMFYVDHKNKTGTLVRSPLNAQNANTLTADSKAGTVAKLVQAMSSSGLEIPSCNAVYSYLHEIVIPDLEKLINLKMDKQNPRGVGNFSLNGLSTNTTPGDYSFYAGDAGSASGNYSISIGNTTDASGISSIALGDHVSAKSNNQVVLGKYNIEDTTGTYGFIFGGGTSSIRKNLFTIDWSGNGVLLGNLTLKDPLSSNHAATKKYVDDMVEATVQLVVIKEV